MLTGYQCEVVAFIGEGEFICHDCAHKQLDEVGFSASERGLGELSPVIRYSLDEYNSERVYEQAEELLRERDVDRSTPRDEQDRWAKVESIVEELGDSCDETCGVCSEVIS